MTLHNHIRLTRFHPLHSRNLSRESSKSSRCASRFLRNSNDCSSTVNLVSSLIIVFGLPLGFYIVFKLLNPIDQLKYASYEIGDGFIRGIQDGINETALNELVKKLANTLIFVTNPTTDIPPIEFRNLRGRPLEYK